MEEDELQQVCEYKCLEMWMNPSGCVKIKNEKIINKKKSAMGGLTRGCSKNESEKI